MPALFALVTSVLTSFLPILNKQLLRDACPALVAWCRCHARWWCPRRRIGTRSFPLLSNLSASGMSSFSQSEESLYNLTIAFYTGAV